MRFKPMELYSLEETGRDELNNPIYVPVLIEGDYTGKITQWTVEEIALIDRSITKTQRKLLTDAPISVLKSAERIAIDNDTYSIVDVKSDFVRWRMCHIKEYYT